MIILGCKVGPLMPFWLPKLHKLKTKVIINPDGLEWTREKWAWWIKQCFKISERFSIKYSDYCVCDSKSILEYVKNKYKKIKTPATFIAYGAYENLKINKNEIVKNLWQKYNIISKNYYLIVGRFIPENNYETMVKEFMKSASKKDFVIITGVDNNKFYENLMQETQFQNDKRIKFVGTVYDSELLKKIRENAYGYFHGHEVGGTNPSLLEALGSTDLNLLLNVGFNREVGEDAALYWDKTPGSLSGLIDQADKLDKSEIDALGEKAKRRIEQEYSWDIIVEKYENIFKRQWEN